MCFTHMAVCPMCKTNIQLILKPKVQMGYNAPT